MRIKMMKLLALVCLAAMVLSLAGCGGILTPDELMERETPENTPNQTPQNETYVPPADGSGSGIGGPLQNDSDKPPELPTPPKFDENEDPPTIDTPPAIAGTADIFGNSSPGGEALEPFDEKDSERLASIIREACELGDDIEVHFGSECLDYLYDALELESRFVGAAACAYSASRQSPYLVCIVRANINSDDYITSAYNICKQVAMKDFQNSPVEYNIAENTKIFTAMPYMCLVMGESGDAADTIDQILEHPDEYNFRN